MKNVILLTIDTLRKDALGCYGSSIDTSPFIDSIQEKCIRFNKAQSTGPYTQASFPAILTSSYYLDHVKQEKSKQYLSDKRVLISEVLQYPRDCHNRFPFECVSLGDLRMESRMGHVLRFIRYGGFR